MGNAPLTSRKPRKKTNQIRRIGSEATLARAAILDATQAIMLEQGYAAATVRRIASKAKVTPGLVQYYFPKLDDLLLALFRRGAARAAERQAKALASPYPLVALLELSSDIETAALGHEFMALANHRDVIRKELTALINKGRRDHARTVSRLVAEGVLDSGAYPPVAIAMLISIVGRALAMERRDGITAGHKETRAIFDMWVAQSMARKPQRRVKLVS
jgi:AcrR family transcriptional regulator